MSNSETEGTPRKISKSESAISTLTVIDDESSEEESNLSITHLSDQTTVIKTKQETSLERHIRESREYLLSKEYFEYCCETSRYYSDNLNDYGTYFAVTRVDEEGYHFYLDPNDFNDSGRKRHIGPFFRDVKEFFHFYQDKII